MKRPGVTVAARKGYFAVRDPGGMPVNTWEAPALGALEQKPVPNAFPVRAGALLFPERGRPGLVPVVVDLKTAPLTFQATADGKTYSSDFTVLVRFLDGQNQVARKVSQHYEVTRPDRADRTRQTGGSHLLPRVRSSRPASTPWKPWSTTRRPASRACASRPSKSRSRMSGKLRMSSLVLVKRGEKLSEKDRRADNPLLVKDMILSPNLGEPVSKASKELAFYFAVYPVQGGPAPESVIELLQNGASVAQLPMPVPAADAYWPHPAWSADCRSNSSRPAPTSCAPS